MKEIDYENDIKKVYQQLHVDEHQVTVLKQRLEKEKRKTLSGTFKKYAAAAVICSLILPHRCSDTITSRMVEMLFSLSAHFVEKFSGRTAIAFCHGFPEPLLFFLVHDSHALVSPDQLQQPLSFGRIVFDHYMCHSGQVFNSS